MKPCLITYEDSSCVRNIQIVLSRMVCWLFLNDWTSCPFKSFSFTIWNKILYKFEDNSIYNQALNGGSHAPTALLLMETRHEVNKNLHKIVFFVFIFLLTCRSGSRYTCINTVGQTEQIIHLFLNMAFCFMPWEGGSKGTCLRDWPSVPSHDIWKDMEHRWNDTDTD